MDNSGEGANGGVSLLKWTLQVLQSAKRHATSMVDMVDMVGMVGMVGIVLNLFIPRCGIAATKVRAENQFL